MSKKKSLAFTLPLFVYPSDIRFSFNEKGKTIKKVLSKYYVSKKDYELIKYNGNSCLARYVLFSNGFGLIRMRSIPKKAIDFSALQHEITHIVNSLLNFRYGMPHTIESTEAYAYLTGYITDEVYKNLPKFK